MEDLAQSIQPKERLYSNGYLNLSCKLCTKLSYRDAAEMLSLFQHRDADQAMKLRTLSDCIERAGSRISDELEKTTGKVLKMYGLDAETGLPMEGVCLSSSITDPMIPERTGYICPDSMRNEKSNVFPAVISYFYGLLQNRLVFFTDGARNIKSSIEEMFTFHPYTVIINWYHLKKKCQELLSMAVKGKEARNKILEKLLRILWVGDVKNAVSYLEGLSPAIIKNQKWLDEQINYLKRKEYSITCYAVRAGLGLRNSSNPVEKSNDILVAQRQKHNGMSWSEHGSSALAAIEMVYQNRYEDTWFRHERISFVMPKAETDTSDLCA